MSINSLDDFESNTNGLDVEIITNDNISYKLTEKMWKQSGMLTVALEQDKETKTINLNLVSSVEFKYIYEYLEYSTINKPSNIPKPIIDTTLKQYLSEWELQYLDNLYKNKMLAKIASVSNYFDIKSLMELSCAKIASLIKGKINTDEIDMIINTL